MSSDFMLLPITTWRPRIVAVLVGCYFLIAAGLKLWSGVAVTIGEGGYAPALQFLAIQIEIVLGSCLILGCWRVAAWISACLLVTILAGLSVSSALAGQSDCGCFGNVKVNPLYTAVLNFAALVLLFVAHPRVKLRENIASYVAVGALALVLGPAAWIANGPVGASLIARLRGEYLVLTPPLVDAGEGRVSEVKTLTVTIQNHSERAVNLIGGSYGCSCTTTKNLPLTIPANASAAIDIEITFKGTPGEFNHRFEFFTDIKTQPRLHGVVVGRVADPTQ